MTLKNLKEISSGGLSQLFVLTANTRNLTDEDREKAIEYLEDFVKEANIPVINYFKFFSGNIFRIVNENIKFLEVDLSFYKNY